MIQYAYAKSTGMSIEDSDVSLTGYSDTPEDAMIIYYKNTFDLHSHKIKNYRKKIKIHQQILDELEDDIHQLKDKYPHKFI